MMKEGATISSLKTSGVSIAVHIHSIVCHRLGDEKEAESTEFDVNADLEEKKRRSGSRDIQFTILVKSRPSTIKFKVEGMATVDGKDSQIDKILEIDPTMKIPAILHRVYQHVFTAIFLLASIMNSPYPPPDLLFTSQPNKLNLTKQSEDSEKKVEIEETMEVEAKDTERKIGTVAGKKAAVVRETPET